MQEATSRRRRCPITRSLHIMFICTDYDFGFFFGVLIIVIVVIRKLLHGDKEDIQQIQDFLKAMFVKRVQRVSWELQRKAFHVAGLLIPSAYIASVQIGLMTRGQAAALLGFLAGTQICIEIGRKVSPAFNKFVVSHMRKTMRPEELQSVKTTGTPFFMTGNFLVVWLFPPIVAVVSQLYLVVGDFNAAVFGIAYGQTIFPKPIYGNKSLEGSSACFISCLIVGVSLLSWSAPLLSWATILIVTFGSSFVATVVELFSDDGLFNDNLTIPFSSALAIQLLVTLCGGTLDGDTVRLNFQ